MVVFDAAGMGVEEKRGTANIAQVVIFPALCDSDTAYCI